MKHLLYLLMLLLALCLQPVGAQDGDDDSDDIIEGDDSGGMSEEDAEEIRKRNSGLAGGGAGRDDDAFAPKIKGSLQEAVNKAIKNGVAWLKERQNKDGSWAPVTANRDYVTGKVGATRVRDGTGPTAFALYALAKCGVSKKDPAIKKGLAWLTSKPKYVNGQDPKIKVSSGWYAGKAWDQTGDKRFYQSTPYESAAVVLMIEAVFTKSQKNTRGHRKRKLSTDNPRSPPTGSKIPKKMWQWMHERIVWLTTGIRGKRTIKGCQTPNGGWRYGQAGGGEDLSSTQFVLLALRAASQAGYPVEKTQPNAWQWAAKFIKACQRSNGGFAYDRKAPKTSGSMTACGIASLVICKEQMALAGQPVPGWMDDSIKKGLDHLDTIFVAGGNPGGGEGGATAHHYYYLYGVERVGDLTGRSEFNKKNWYLRGANVLIPAQAPDGMWTDRTAFAPQDVLGTCYALLFLKRATPPTVTAR
ncbi:MAG: terpene cyclase/mutase family protein [Planctomycetota bacterium]|nr:terpene cyclase/mutase family protein [Planctomycetota bacterium]